MKNWIAVFVITITLAAFGFASVAQSASLTLGGDVRYRYEVLDPGNTSDSSQQIRGRIGADFDLDDGFSAGLRLNTGDVVLEGNDLDISVDQLYINYTLSGLSLTGGKMESPFYNAGGGELLMDEDDNPEGLAVNYTSNLGIIGINATAAHFEIDGTNDLTGAQGGVTLGIFTVGAGYYTYIYEPLKYNIAEYYAETTITFANYMIELYGDYAISEADNEGWVAGATTGLGDLTLGYKYVDVENGSVGAYTDDDFNQGDVEGYKISAGYQINKSVALNADYINANSDDTVQGNLVLSF